MKRIAVRGLKALLGPLRRGRAPRSGDAIPALPAFGQSTVAWSKAIEVPFAAEALPGAPSALTVTVAVERGHAGIGWYDADGLAEEIIVGPGPCIRTVKLTLWEPGLCRSLIIRSAGPGRLQVTLVEMTWSPLHEALAGRFWPVHPVGTDMFLDLPFRGTLAESLWRTWIGKSWFEPDLRLKRLQRLVRLAWDHCPGYREWWLRHGWHPSDLKSLADAADIPAVGKAQIRKALDTFSLRRRNALRSSTAGTSGEPLTFRYTAAHRAAQQSHLAIAYSLADPGLPPWQQRLIVARGKPVRGPSVTGAGGSLVLSPTAFRQPDLLAELMRAYRPTGLFAHPFTAARVADVLAPLGRLRAAVVASEPAYASDMAAIERLADGVVATYGLAESAVAALRCRACGAYGDLPSHGVTTLRPRADGLFDIIGTAFWALDTLFIAYETGDVTAGPVDPCPHCPPGGLRFADVVGRGQDTLIDCRGCRHPFMATVGSRRVIDQLAEVVLYDCLQLEPGRVVVRYASRDGRRIDEDAILRALRLSIPDIAFELRLEPALPQLRDELPPGTKWKLVKPPQQ